jgi:hypothetical protein
MTILKIKNQENHFSFIISHLAQRLSCKRPSIDYRLFDFFYDERVTILLVTLFVFPLVVPFQLLDIVVQTEDGASQEERLGDVHERTIVHIVDVYHLDEG